MNEAASAAAPEPELPSLESQVEDAIAVCDGDVRAALAAALIYNTFLERKLDMMRGMISSGFARGKMRRPESTALPDRGINSP